MKLPFHVSDIDPIFELFSKNKSDLRFLLVRLFKHFELQDFAVPINLIFVKSFAFILHYVECPGVSKYE